MRTLTFEIERTECVGDSIGKHNYNILSLDTTLCNLSSHIFNIDNNILSLFNDMSAWQGRYDQMANNFSDTGISAYNINHTTINVLSSYWNTSEMSVQYPHDLTFNGTISAYSANVESLSAILKTSTLYLSANYNSNLYPKNSRANVVMFLYSLLDPKTIHNDVYSPKGYVDSSVGNLYQDPVGGAIVQSLLTTIDDYDVGNSRITYDQVSKVFGTNANPKDQNQPYWYKTVRVDFSKDSIYVKNICTIRYYNTIKNNNLKWVPYEIVWGSDPTVNNITLNNAISSYNRVN